MSMNFQVFKGRVLFFLIMILSVMLKTPISALIYDPDQNLIEQSKLRTERLANEFSEWVNSVPKGNPKVEFSFSHFDAINASDYSPDGRFIVTASEDKTIKLWDVENQRVTRTFKGHEDNVSAVKFTPDGRKIISGDWRSSIRVWDVLSGEELQKIATGGWIYSLAISPDGKNIVAGAGSNVKIWNIRTGRLIHKMTDHKNSVYTVSYSPDGSLIASGSREDESVIKIWNAANGRLIRTLEGHRKAINSLSFSPDGLYLVSGSKDETHRVWEVSTGQIIRVNRNHSNYVYSVAFSPDGKFIATAAGNDGVQLWDASNGNMVWQKKLGWVDSISFSPEGLSIFSPLKSLDIATGDILLDFSEYTYTIGSVNFSPDSRQMVSSYYDYQARLWDVATGRLLHTLKGHTNWVTKAVFSPDGGTIATLALDRKIKLWDSSNGILLRTIDSFEARGTLVFSPDGHFLATTTDDDIVIMEVSSGKVVRTLKLNGDMLSYLSFSPDSTILALAFRYGGTTALYNVDTGNLIHEFSKIDSNHVRTFCFSPDSNYFVSGSEDNNIQVFDFQAGRISLTFEGGKSGITSAIYSPDGRYFATTSGDKSIKLWNASSGQEILNFSGEGFYYHISFSLDGRYLVAIDGADIKIWNTSNGYLVRTLKGHNSNVTSLSFSADGRFIASSSSDDTIKLWTLSDTKPLYSILANYWSQSFVWSPEGYFSGDKDFAKKKLCVIDGFNNYSIDQLFEIFYRPDIIEAKVAGRDISHLIDENQLEKIMVPPPVVQIEVERVDGRFLNLSDSTSEYRIIDGKVQIRVTAIDQGGGVEEIRLFHNGVRVSGDTRGLRTVRRTEYSSDFTIQLINGENNLRAIGLTTTRIESNPTIVVLSYSAPNLIEPKMWLLAVGINEYKNSRYDLNYAVSDASGFLQAVEESGSDLFSHIDSTLLTDESATREGITSALERIQMQAKADDVFIFFYAGHGIALEVGEDNKTEFFFIPTDVTQMTSLTQVETLGLSGPDFENLVSAVPARKQFLVLDACNSGAINASFVARGAAEEIALSRLNRATGSTLIAASREDQFAQEFSALGQGALTKALLNGFAGRAALENGQITVGSLKSFVESELPLLTTKYAGQAQYPMGFVFGQDFPIGVK